MITVHHLNKSRSQRVLWLLEELGVPYEVVRYERDPKTSLAPPELEKIHPLGKSPVITDDGTTVAETAVIMEYILDKYGNGRLVPQAGTPEYWRYRYFMHYPESSLMPYLLLKLVMHRIRTGAPLLVRPIAAGIAAKVNKGYIDPNLDRHMAFLSSTLGKSPYFAGNELTACDINMSYAMEAIATRLPEMPAVFADFVKRIRDRPAFKRAEEKGGSFSIAG